MNRLFLSILLCAFLAGCAVPAPVSDNRTSLPSPAVTISAAEVTAPVPASPTPLPVTPTGSPSPTVQPTARAQGRQFASANLGLSFTYPDDWETLPRQADAPPGVSLHGPAVGEGPEPIIFAITIDVQPVAEKSVTEIVDQQLQQVPEDLRSKVQRRPVTVGGEQGEEVVGLPSVSGAMEAFVLHDGNLYLIILQPYDENNVSLIPYLDAARAAYQGILNSWQFTK